MPWSNWKVEETGFPFSGAPAVASWMPGRLDVFVRGTDNRLFHRVFENEAWQGSGWLDVSDGRQIETTPAAVSWGPNRIDLFAVWDKQVHHRAFQNGSWSPWAENLDGITNDAPAAAASKLLRVDVLVRTSDNHLARRYWENAVTVGWQKWENVAEGSSLMSAPAAVATATERVDCFGRNASSRLLHGWYQGVIEESLSEVDTLSFQDAPAVVSGVSSDRGRVDIFLRGVDDLLKHRVYYTTLRRSVPSGRTTYTAVKGDYLLKIARKYNMSLAEIKTLNPQVRPPDYIIHPGDQILVEGHGTEAIYSDWESGSSWESIGASKIFSAPAAVGWWSANILKRIDCFAQGANNQLVHTWWA